MKCKECGKEFIRKSGNQKYCCKDCLVKHYRKSYIPKERKPFKKKCFECGKVFMTKANNAKYCSKKCKRKHVTESEKGTRGGKDRKFTPMTPYLCQKWHREGMPTRQIAEILNRSVENVKSALDVKLSGEAYREMEEFARHRTSRRAQDRLSFL